MSKSKTRPKKSTPSMLRIIGGEHRGRKLPIPELEGLRPTSDRIRETVFNWLQFDLPGMDVLDLFAGTGALGLEAISREARHCTFVEPQAIAASGIQQSLKTLSINQGEVITQSSELYLNRHPAPVDLVFVDPPFADNLWEKTLAKLVNQGWLKKGAFVYVESPRDAVFDVPDTLMVVKDKTGGKVRFRLLQFS